MQHYPNSNTKWQKPFWSCSWGYENLNYHSCCSCMELLEPITYHHSSSPELQKCMMIFLSKCLATVKLSNELDDKNGSYTFLSSKIWRTWSCLNSAVSYFLLVVWNCKFLPILIHIPLYWASSILLGMFLDILDNNQKNNLSLCASTPVSTGIAFSIKEYFPVFQISSLCSCSRYFYCSRKVTVALLCRMFLLQQRRRKRRKSSQELRNFQVLLSTCQRFKT